MHVRNSVFHGFDFTCLEYTQNDYNVKDYFNLNDLNDLTGFFIKFKIPIIIMDTDHQSDAFLSIDVDVGYVFDENVQLSVFYHEKSYTSKNNKENSNFEDAFLSLNASLPESVFVKSCFNCLFSDYNPAGSGFFGCLMCFQKNRNTYLNASSKEFIMDIWDLGERHVQEIYVCENFQKRKSGTGYRG